MLIRKSGVAAFAFGVPDTIRSNKIIGAAASGKARVLQAPVYTQRDVPIDQDIEVTRIPEEEGRPPSTLRMARGAIKWAMLRGIKNLWVMAATPHLKRCIRDLKKAMRELRVNITLKFDHGLEEFDDSAWFCLDSEQERTRTREAFSKREWILNHMPFLLYKLVTKLSERQCKSPT